MNFPDPTEIRVAIIGLGYVGLPLALAFAKKFDVIGFDINATRIAELQEGRDRTKEVEPDELKAATSLAFTSEPDGIRDANVYIITVPTPIDDHKRPDLRPLISASETVGKVMNAGDVVIYESTVYPGCTEEDCVPILEAESGLTCAFEVPETDTPCHPGLDGIAAPQLSELAEKALGSGPSDFDFPETGNPKPETDTPCHPGLDPGPSNFGVAGEFAVGYSPERINPGDKAHRVTDIVKVTSGSTPEAAKFVDDLYKSVITAGTHKAPSIKVAEAAKVIENTQRDVNIGLINELAMLFGRMGLDTAAVLEAAGTKWNFLPFRPGLVGGHCIGVDPYYLTHKAQHIGFHPEMILAGRRTNDGMGAFVAGELVKHMARKGVYSPGARVLVLGLTFKENCPDLRNTRVVDVIKALEDFNLEVHVHDPWADPAEARAEYGLELISEPEEGAYHAITLAVAHNEFRSLGNSGIQSWTTENAVIYDLKHVLPDDQVDARL